MALTFVMTVPAGAPLNGALEGLVCANVALMQASLTPFPHIGTTDVLFRQERRSGVERWQTAPELLRSGVGDCEDIAGYHAAWLRCYGSLDAEAVAVPTGDKRWHAVVRSPDGRQLDIARFMRIKEKSR